MANQAQPAKRTGQLLLTVGLGTLVLALYGLLYVYSEELIAMARQVANGDKTFFLAPIVIAFVFSLAHGAFTGHFWDLLGLKPKKH